MRENSVELNPLFIVLLLTNSFLKYSTIFQCRVYEDSMGGNMVLFALCLPTPPWHWDDRSYIIPPVFRVLCLGTSISPYCIHRPVHTMPKLLSSIWYVTKSHGRLSSSHALFSLSLLYSASTYTHSPPCLSGLTTRAHWTYMPSRILIKSSAPCPSLPFIKYTSCSCTANSWKGCLRTSRCHAGIFSTGSSTLSTTQFLNWAENSIHCGQRWCYLLLILLPMVPTFQSSGIP